MTCPYEVFGNHRRKMHDYDRAGLAAVVIRLIW
jgi:hypothetical protein